MRGVLALWLCAGSLLAATPVEQANQLLREAKALSDRGQIAEAIRRFRAAEALVPRGIHDCNLGLAYAKLKKPAQALFYLESCRARSSEKLPEWVDGRIDSTREELARAGHHPLEVSSEPTGARVIASSLGSDCPFVTPRRVWVPAGEVELSATLPGYDELRLKVHGEPSVRLELQKPPARVELQQRPDVQKPPELQKPPEVQKPAATAAPVEPVEIVKQPLPRDTRRVRRVAGAALLGVGAGLVAVGLILNMVAIYQTRPDAEMYQEGNAFQSRLNTFHLERDLSISGYAIGGAAALAGAATLISTRF